MFEKYEDYLRGEMTEKEGDDFLKNLTEKDREDFNVYQSIREKMTKQGKEIPNDLKDKLSDLGRKHFKEEKVITKRLPPMYLRIAALFFLLAGAAFLYTNVMNPIPNVDLLVENFYYSKKSNVVHRGTGEESEFAEGMRVYESGNYEGSLLHFDKIKNNDSLFMESAYYRANAHFKNGNYELAAQMYLDFSGRGDDLEDYAEWNMMLAHLKLGNEKKVNEVLDRILVQANHVMFQRAKEFKEQY